MASDIILQTSALAKEGSGFRAVNNVARRARAGRIRPAIFPHMIVLRKVLISLQRPHEARDAGSEHAKENSKTK